MFTKLKVLEGDVIGNMGNCGQDIMEQLKHYLPLARQAVCQTRRRILGGESVPAPEKIVSIFEAQPST
jgi:hypothetical protein